MSDRDAAPVRDLAAILESCLVEVEDGASPEECLARRPDVPGEVESLLRTAMGLRGVLQVEPSPGRTAAVRARVLAAASEARSAAGRQRRPWPLVRLLPPVLASILALAMMTAFTVNASAGAVPGDALYPVKRTAERLHLAATLDAEDRAALHVEFSRRRLEEAQRLDAGGREVGAGLLADLARELEAGARGQEQGRLSRDGAVKLATVARSARGFVMSARGRLPGEAAARLLDVASRIDEPDGDERGGGGAQESRRDPDDGGTATPVPSGAVPTPEGDHEDGDGRPDPASSGSGDDRDGGEDAGSVSPIAPDDVTGADDLEPPGEEEDGSDDDDPEDRAPAATLPAPEQPDEEPGEQDDS